MHTIRSHGGNANQNHEEMPLHSSKNGYYQRDKDDKSWEDVQEREPFLAQCGWEHMNAPILPEGMDIPLKILSLFVTVLFTANNGGGLSVRPLMNTHACDAYTQDDFSAMQKDDIPSLTTTWMELEVIVVS